MLSEGDMELDFAFIFVNYAIDASVVMLPVCIFFFMGARMTVIEVVILTYVRKILNLLQVLLSQVHRSRALDLLGRFLDLGPWAVSLVSDHRIRKQQIWY